MNEVFFDELRIPRPDIFLSCGKKESIDQVGMVIRKLQLLLKQKNKIDTIFVSGDTNSAFAGGYSAIFSRKRLAHYEAGMRSFDKNMPEEINRTMLDHISSVLLTPTANGRKNLERENITRNVFLVGDIMLDSFLHNKRLLKKKNVVEEFDVGEYDLMTIHRQENTNDIKRLKRIFLALEKYGETIIFPIHPRTQKILLMNGIRLPSNIKVIKPLGYLDFLRVIYHSKKVITDSGGVQKQAYFMKRRCITLRDTTEWVETLKFGWNVLVRDDERILLNALKTIPTPKKYFLDAFGKGDTAKRITKILRDNN
jgi:UDP-GlcNAc3NAcA epimerase